MEEEINEAIKAISLEVTRSNQIANLTSPETQILQGLSDNFLIVENLEFETNHFTNDNDPWFTIDPLTDEPVITEGFIHDLMGHFEKKKLLGTEYLYPLFFAATACFRSLPTLIQVALPRNSEGEVIGRLTVIGDLHGQYLDLCEIFHIQGV